MNTPLTEAALVRALAESRDVLIERFENCLREQQAAIHRIEQDIVVERTRMDTHGKIIESHEEALGETVTRDEVKRHFAVFGAIVALAGLLGFKLEGIK